MLSLPAARPNVGCTELSKHASRGLKRLATGNVGHHSSAMLCHALPCFAMLGRDLLTLFARSAKVSETSILAT